MSATRVITATAARSGLRSVGLTSVFIAVIVVAVANSYRSLYVSPTDRAALAALIEGNRAFESLFGAARGLDTVQGFTAWRAGTPLLIVIAVIGLLTATRLLRGEEDAGRWEIVLAGATDPTHATAATLGALAGLMALPALSAGIASLAAEVTTTQAVAQSLALWAHGAVFAGLGAVASQLVAPRRRAAGLAAVLMGAAFVVRVVADGVAGWAGLGVLTPFGWAQRAQPLAEIRWAWVATPFAVAAILGAVAVVFARRRDLGAGWLPTRDARRSSPILLGSGARYALRSAARPAIVWTLATGAMATLLGLLAADIVGFLGTSDAFARFASRLGPGFSLGGAESFLGMAVTFLAIPVALAGVYRIAAARDEEATGRLDVTLAGATRRAPWIVAWAGAGVLVAGVVALVAATAAYGVAALRGADVRIADGWAAALNTLPAAAVFVGIGVLVFGLRPRWTAGVSVGLVGVAEVVALLGAQRAVPAWLLDLSPFAYVRPVPTVPADTQAAAILVLIAVVAVAVGAAAFARRDVAHA